MSDIFIRNAWFDTLFATDGLYWMGQNTNHLPPHPEVLAALNRSVARAEFNAYAPPLGFESLRKAIVADAGLDGVEAMVTDGGVNALSMICRARCRPGTSFVTTDPSWKWPCQFAEQMGSMVIQIPIWRAETRYRLTPDALAAAVDDRTAIIYLVDPNNPLGVSYSEQELAAFIAIARRHNALLVHDCTYRDFAAEHAAALGLDQQHVVMSVSFSKWLGLAGLRVGALIASRELLAELAPFNSGVLGASVVAQRAAEAGLKVKASWMATLRAIDARNKDRIAAAVAAIPGLALPVFPSGGNFLVIEVSEAGVRPEALVECYLRRGIQIRQGAYHTATFGDRFVKVSTSVPEPWAETFSALLPEMVEQARKLTDFRQPF
ncbi:pyridoxal phosphate-dependent aminotransferase [Affinibrenneria salicis]|uniref:Aminotransferase n=1 Tax=Affinibrenneria salicis TaxID=2590031 RepID=A0A5J5FQ86_9GAMM|nr:pyridoxal phosphate-dependent aminotransferase [Affinibrenneria salicis]KAA8994996.1 pyridoxal phosphate-dependent aminotransferase [Affinibrenneria salicis]